MWEQQVVPSKLCFSLGGPGSLPARFLSCPPQYAIFNSCFRFLPNAGVSTARS